MFQSRGWTIGAHNWWFAANLHSEFGVRNRAFVYWRGPLQFLPDLRHAADDDRPLGRGVHFGHNQPLHGHSQPVPIHPPHSQ